MNGPLKFLTARKILPLVDLLAKFKRVLTCSCSPNFCVARKLAKQIFYFCSCSQKNRSARHARECSLRPFVTPRIVYIILSFTQSKEDMKSNLSNLTSFCMWTFNGIFASTKLSFINWCGPPLSMVQFATLFTNFFSGCIRY